MTKLWALPTLQEGRRICDAPFIQVSTLPLNLEYAGGVARAYNGQHSTWQTFDNAKDWWESLSHHTATRRKALA
jgi:hypothetical protein